ncbi:MAG: 3'-5' exonuclease [Paludibacteraceae bacterium]|nr:3'-5' exonuclease [Paludibacteraceae bacterium]
MNLVAFDTETTGLDVQKEHIIQLSLIKFDTDTWEIIGLRDWYILPDVPFTIPAEAEAVHHISKAFLLEHGVSLKSIYNDFIAFTAGCDFLTYNGNGYDAPILHYNLVRAGLDFDFNNRTWYDALLLERIHSEGQTDENGERLHNNLTAAYTRYYGHPFEGAHNSLDDVRATIEVFKAQVAAHGWAWAQREEFNFICYDRWLTKKGGYYYLNQGAHKNESIESMLRIDKSYLTWIVDKCQWTDDQTRAIIEPYLGRHPTDQGQSQCQRRPKAKTLPSSRGKKRSKGTISDADLSLF